MKSLRPHLYRYVPKYFAKKYPKYVSLMENFLIFLETKNSLNFFDGTTERDHSIYNNIIDFDKHAQIDNLPVKNKDILNAYFKEYATTLDFRNQVLSFDEETMKMLAKFSGMIFNTKSSWSSYNLLFAIISTYLFNGAERGVVFKAFFNEDFTFDTEDAPDFYDIITVSDITKFSYSDFIKNAGGAYGFVKLIDTTTNQIYVDTYNGTFTTGDSLFNLAGALLDAGITVDNSDSIGRNEIILSEYPLYKINIGFDGVEVDKNVITGKGTRPFEYQLISKSNLFVSGNFVSKLKTGFNPAGFKNEIIYVPEDIECETYYDSKIFPKIKLDIETAHVYSTMTLDTYPDHAEIDEVFTVSGKANCSQVKITFTSTSGEVSYVVSVVDGAYSKADCALAVADGFSPLDDVTIRVEDNEDVLSYVEQADAMVIVPTMEFDTPIELVAGVEKAVTGTSNFVGQHIDLESRLSDQDPEDEWTLEGQATVDEFGVWSVNVTIASAGTRDFRVIDENIDPVICSAQVDDVDVASGTIMIDDFELYTVGSNIGAPWSSAAAVWKCNNSYSSKAGEYGANDWQNDLVARDFPDQPLNLTGKKISMKVRKGTGVTVSNHRFYVRNNLGQNVAQLEVNSPTGYSDSAWTTLEWTLTAISGQNLNTCKSIALSWRTTSYAGRIYIDDLKII